MTAWALSGAAAGTLVALVAFAPATWLSRQLAETTGGRLLLADAQGTVWRGHGVLVLTGGPDSRDASALPSRLHWHVGMQGLRPALWLKQACCIDGEWLLSAELGLGAWRVDLRPQSEAAAGPLASVPNALAASGDTSTGASSAAAEARPTTIGHWPVAWLSGLGAPLNTLRLSGSMQLSAQGLSVASVQGRTVLGGQAELVLNQVASRISTLPVLGDYRVQIQGDPRSQAATLQLRTDQGALQLSGDGQWVASRLRFNGQAAAAPGAEAALNNLLNIIGRRQGALSLISIGTT